MIVPCTVCGVDQRCWQWKRRQVMVSSSFPASHARITRTTHTHTTTRPLQHQTDTMNSTPVVWAVVLCLLCTQASALSVSIAANTEECYYEATRKEESLTLSFQVSSGGFLDINVKVTAPDGSEVYSGERETEGRYHFIARQDGVYTFCFSNKMSTLTPKTLSFSISNSLDEVKNEDSLAKQEHLTPLEASLLQLSDGLSAIQAEQKYMRSRERVHRATADSTNERVFWWSVFEALVLVALSVWQILHLRKFLEVKSEV